MALSEQLEKSFKDPTPFYAIVGAGDLAVKKVREVRAEAQERMAKTPDVKTLPDKAQAAMSDVVSQAFSTYTELANRGKDLLTKMREQPVSSELAVQDDALNDQVEDTVDTAMDAAESQMGEVPVQPADAVQVDNLTAEVPEDQLAEELPRDKLA
jgi:hypothetical protein